MLKYDLIVVGFGKAGKTLAVKFAKMGKKVAVIEKDSKMYGGTCINVGCIPTKTMIRAAFSGEDFSGVMGEKEAVTSRLRGKNYAMIESAPADIFTATAKFISDKEIEITSEDGSKEVLSAENIVINTGSKSVVPEIKGLKYSRFTFDSNGIQELKNQPKNLAIIGGGNIGLEFATLYSKMGSKVTIFETGDKLLSRDEPEVSEMMTQYILDAGIEAVYGARIEEIKDLENEAVLVNNGEEYKFDGILYATGRTPNTEELGLENTEIKLGERGEVLVDDNLQTDVKGIFAVGDVNGGMQFTYISLDDFRIVFSYLAGSGEYALKDRKNVPNSTFLNPVIARVGLTESQAKEKGFDVKVNSLPVAAMPKAHVEGDLRGIYKVVVDASNNQILGATLLGNNSYELINMIKMAMDNNIPYTYFKNQIFTHPSYAENFNDLFNF